MTEASIKHFPFKPELVDMVRQMCEKRGVEFDDTEKGGYLDETREHCTVGLMYVTHPARDGVVQELMIEQCPEGPVHLLQLAHVNEGTDQQDSDIIWEEEYEFYDEVVMAVESFISDPQPV